MADTSLVAVLMQNAEDDLRSAEQASSGERHDVRSRAFYFQQAAEKALKAALVMSGRDAPHTHDLTYLRDNLPPDWDVNAPALGNLTTMAVTARYGNGGTTPTKPEEDWALGVAADIVDAVRARTASGP